MQPVKIIRQQQQSELQGNGLVKKLIRVDFMVGDDGPFSVTVDADNYTADFVHQKIMDVANQADALRAKLGTV